MKKTIQFVSEQTKDCAYIIPVEIFAEVISVAYEREL